METNATNAALSARLLALPVRTGLFPLVKLLGGLSVAKLRQLDQSYGHYTNAKAAHAVQVMLDTYSAEQIEAALAAQTNAAPAAAAPAPAAAEMAALWAIIQRIAGSGGVDEGAVREIAGSVLADATPALILAARAEMVTTVRIERTDAPTIDVGVQHRRFPTLLKMLNARLPNGRRINVWLHGPAATGKTTAARCAAKALGLNFFFTGAIETAYALMGYTDAHGRTVRTPFRDAWEHGGVFLMDEVDASHPQALAALNAAIDGGVAAFPDKMVERHADFALVAGANTVGRGGSSKFAGRVRQDEAFLSRYSMLEWAHDDLLEQAMVGTDKEAIGWMNLVRSFRLAADRMKIDGASTTTRATLDGAALLAAGLTKDEVLEAVVRKGMPSDSWTRLKEAAGG